MKKVLSLFLSIVMLTSITAGLDLTAYASTLDNPITITFDKVYSGNLNVNNRSAVYKVTLPKSGILHLKFWNYVIDRNSFGREWAGRGLFGSCNGGYKIYDCDKDRFYSNYSGYQNNQSCCYLTDSLYLLAGTYYIEEDSDSTYYGDYKLQLSFESSNESFVESMYDAYDSLANARAIDLNKTYYGQLGDYCDYTDVYKFYIPVKSTVTITTFNYCGWKSPEFFLYDNPYASDNEYIEKFQYLYQDSQSCCYGKQTLTLNKGTYYFRMKKIDHYPNMYKFSVNAAVSVDKPSSLKVSSYNDTKIKLTWGKVSGASGYQLQQYKSNKWVTIKNTTANTFTVSNLASGNAYKFRVRAYKTINGSTYYGPFVNIANAITKPAAPTLNSISTSKNHTIKIGWKKVSGSASGYQVCWAKDKNFKNVIAYKYVGGQGKTTYTGKNFTKGKRYYVRIRSYKKINNKNYYSKWSAGKSIVCK